jgi:uncharacterized membrane protein
MASLFEFLFKYRPGIFSQGEFHFAPAPLVYLAFVAVGAAVATTFVSYRRLRGTGRTRDRVVLVALRLAVLALACFCLLRPVLVLRAAVPQQNFLGVLVDDSRSMRIADGGEPRSTAVARLLAMEQGQLLANLSERFVVRLFRFSSSTERLPAAGDLTFEGSESRLGEALQRARDELAGLPVAGFVMLSDGADTTETAIAESLLPLKADGIPVFTVGIGQERLERDIQVNRIAVPATVLKGASLVVDAVVTQAGFAGRSVALNVESDGRIVGTEKVTLAADGEPASVRVHFTAADAGPHLFRFRVPPQEGEAVAENNVREALVTVRDDREKILYFEGEPRFEVKFARRAITDDRNLQLVVLQRTAENKYLRLDVDNADELVAGFPKTREELFSYRGLVLGSIEAAAFTGDQLRMITDFVDRRGGGLMMIGGPRAFAEGAYAGTVVANALPVVLEPPRAAEGGSPVVSRLTVGPTRAGTGHPATQIAATEADSEQKWKDLPQVTSVNPIREVKPGATVLLSGLDEAQRELVALAFHRYGRGKVLAFPIQDSWLWQLHAKMAVDDMTHENFWRQLLRWMVDGVPGTVSVKPLTDRVEPGETVTLSADVVDPTYVEVNNAQVVAYVATPAGQELQVPMQWTGDRDGEYRASFTAEAAGVYEARVEALREDTTIGTGSAHVRAAPSDAEYFDAAMRAPLLRRIAEETGGRYYTAAGASALAEDIKYTGRGVTVVEERELWDMPILLLLLVGLMAAEWGYRRTMGLA